MERREKNKEEMAPVAKNVKVYVRKCLVFSFKISSKFAQDHPFILGAVIFLHILHIYWPSLFYFLVSSSPVFVCTAFLLGTLLVYGEPNIPENKEVRAKNRTKVKEKKVKDAGKGRASASIRTAGHAPLKSVRGKCIENSDGVSAGRSLVGGGNDEICGERKGNNVRFHDQELHKKREFSKGKQAEGAVKASKAGGSIKTRKSDLASHFDSSLGSSRPPLEGNDGSSGSESDDAENSSPDASVTDIIPMLDELHPLLDSEAPQPAHVLADNSDAASSQGDESDDDTVEEEAENQEEDEDEEAQEKDDTNEAVVTWTADDQKNLMDLGSSELERNQRLENLIAKRRARKFLSFHAEKNLIDLDSSDPIPNKDDLSRPHYQILSIYAPRHNPFDLPFDTEESMGLPPIPGSAPSVLQPRRNPFELPLDQFEDGNSHARETMKHQEFAPAPRREMFYRRHESFTLGASFAGEEDLHDSQFKPYFVPNRMDLEGTGLPDLHRQSSEHSDSKSSSVHESDSNSPIIDQEDHMERLEEFDLENHYVKPVDKGSRSSDEVDSADDGHEGVDNDHAIQLNSSTVGEANHLAVESHSPDLHAGNIEVIEERDYDSSSSSSDAFNKNSKNTSKDFSDSILTVPAQSDMSNASHPVYDSSPSAAEKSLSNMPKFDEPSLYAGKAAYDGQLDSPSMLHDINVSSGENLSSGTTELWVAPPSLASVDEIESRSKEVTEISEQDVICAGLSVIHEDIGNPISPVLPEAMFPSRCLSIHSGEDIVVQKDAMIVAVASSDPSESGLLYTQEEILVEAGLKDSDLDVSPVSTNNPEDFGFGKEHESTIDPPLQQIEESEVGLPGKGDKAEAEVSKPTSSFKIGKNIKNIKKLMPGFHQSEKGAHKDSNAAASDVSSIPTNSPESSRAGREHESTVGSPANANSSSSGLQQMEEREAGLSGEGEKLETDGSKPSSSFKIGKIKNIKKFW